MRTKANSAARLALASALAGAALGACTSRTLPLPPPEVSQVSSPDADGFVTVQGRSREGASVGVLNDALLTGTIVTTEEVGCGSSCPFQARLRAESGDPIRVWQFYETEASIQHEVP